MSKRSKKQFMIKITKYLLASFAYLFFLFVILYFTRSFFSVNIEREELPAEAFYHVDYSVNVMDNSAYLSLDRSVYYMNYGTGESLTEENYQKVGIASSFFYEYFESVINGDAISYRSMLTDAYIDAFDPPEKFTMQMLYDIQVNQSHGLSTTSYKGETVNVYHFSVSYKIFENNGTFRRDVASNQAVTQYYDLVYYNGKMLLNGISNNVVINENRLEVIGKRQTMVSWIVIGSYVFVSVIVLVVVYRIKRKPAIDDKNIKEKR
jgi:hypothetical protein